MEIERTLCILKPDVAMTPAAQALLLAIIAADMMPIELQRTPLTQSEAMRLYAAHTGQSYFKRNVDFMTSGLSIVIVLEGEDVIQRLRDRIGPTDPVKARSMWGGSRAFSWRALYGTELPRNAIHASGSAEEAEREIAIFFPEFCY